MVDHVQRIDGLSQRRAGRRIGMDVSGCRYRSRPADDGPLRGRLRALATLRRRFGYGRLGWLLDREGTKVNLKKVNRLRRGEDLAVKCRRRRRLGIGTKTPLIVPRELNQRWSLEVVSDQLGNGRRLRLLNVIDDFNSECLARISHGVEVHRSTGFEKLLCSNDFTLSQEELRCEQTVSRIYLGLKLWRAAGSRRHSTAGR